MVLTKVAYSESVHSVTRRFLLYSFFIASVSFFNSFLKWNSVTYTAATDRSKELREPASAAFWEIVSGSLILFESADLNMCDSVTN